MRFTSNLDIWMVTKPWNCLGGSVKAEKSLGLVRRKAKNYFQGRRDRACKGHQEAMAKQGEKPGECAITHQEKKVS